MKVTANFRLTFANLTLFGLPSHLFGPGMCLVSNGNNEGYGEITRCNMCGMEFEDGSNGKKNRLFKLNPCIWKIAKIKRVIF